MALYGFNGVTDRISAPTITDHIIQPGLSFTRSNDTVHHTAVVVGAEIQTVTPLNPYTTVLSVFGPVLIETLTEGRIRIYFNGVTDRIAVPTITAVSFDL